MKHVAIGIAVVVSIILTALVMYRRSFDAEMKENLYGGSEFKMNFIRSCFEKTKSDRVCECIYEYLESKDALGMSPEQLTELINRNQNEIRTKCK